MKKIIFMVFLSLSKAFIFGQCNCEIINRSDGTKVTQCNAIPIAYDNITEVGLAAASNGQDKFVTVTIRFKSTVQNIIGNLSIRLVDNNLITLKLINSQLAYIGNSQVAQGIFLANEIEIVKFKKSEIKTVTVKLVDGLLRTYQATSNSDVLINQFKCI